jgi:hypothetical protein
MTTKLTRMTHKIAIQLHLVAESCTICSSRSRRPVLKLLDTPSYSLELRGDMTMTDEYIRIWNYTLPIWRWYPDMEQFKEKVNEHSQ